MSYPYVLINLLNRLMDALFIRLRGGDFIHELIRILPAALMASSPLAFGEALDHYIYEQSGTTNRVCDWESPGNGWVEVDGIFSNYDECVAALAELEGLGSGSGTTLPTIPSTLTRTSAFTYNAQGLLTKEIIEPDNSDLCLVTTYNYDAYGNKTGATTRNCNGSSGEAAAPTGDAVIVSRTESTSYDARGQFPVGSANALNQAESRTYDPKWGVPLTLTGPNGLSTTWQYDGFGRKTLEIRADGTRTKWEYLYCSGIHGGTTVCPQVQINTSSYVVTAWLVRETPLAGDGVTRNGPVGTIYYDNLGRVVRKATGSFDGNSTITTVPTYQDTRYDYRGRVVATSDPYLSGQTAVWTTTAYDGLDRPIEIRQPGNTAATYNTTSIIYSGFGVKETNAKGQQRFTMKNIDGEIGYVLDTQNQQTVYAYDPFGNLARTTDHFGNVTSLSYDLRGRKIQMIDPDMGVWTYAYNALGQLIRQTDAKGQVTTNTYDKLGRLTQRNEADLVSKWYYDAYKGGGTCNKGIGKLCQAETTTGYNETNSYDNLGRPIGQAVTVDLASTPYSSAVTYDAHGRLATQTYPSGLAIKHVYTSSGYLKEIRDNSTNALYWQVNAMDAQGRLLQQTAGNGIQTTQSYNAAGRISAIQAGAGSGVQNLSYQYDTIGNVTSRSDSNQNLSESFIYDSLNRLTSNTVNSGGAGIVTQSYSYNALGNMLSKSDLGAYTYPLSGAGSIRPHAVSSVALTGGGAISFTYDANGSLLTQMQTGAGGAVIAARSRTLTYTSYNMPRTITQGSVSTTFHYGPGHQRVKQVSSTQGTTIYVNPGNAGTLFYEKDIKPDSTVEERAFINVGGQAVAIARTVTSGVTIATTLRYLHTDRLGSITAITNETGTVIERFSYDPFGKRRFPSGAADPNNTIAPQNTDRGFTGHEMLDEVGLIHMNGRVYDPAIGRFLSADPLIQDPANLQSFNRYTYLWNNPLAGIDPSGYGWLSDIWKGIKNIGRSIERTVRDFVSSTVGRAIIGIATAWIVGPLVTGWAQGVMESAIASTVGGMAGGFAGSLTASGGDFRAGIIGGLTAGAMYGVGSYWPTGTAGNIAGHAAVGCASSVASGGKCGSGALSAGVSAWATPQIPNNWKTQYQIVAISVVGGTTSVIGGGKFENGAVTAAFGYLFNHLAHIGVSGRIPFLGGGKASIGISWHEGEFDMGFIFEVDIPSVNVGKMLFAKKVVEIGYQPGDFDSVNGSMDKQIQAHLGTLGFSYSTDAQTGRFSGASAAIGLGYGLSITGTTSSTISVRQFYRQIVRPALDWIRERF